MYHHGEDDSLFSHDPVADVDPALMRQQLRGYTADAVRSSEYSVYDAVVNRTQAFEDARPRAHAQTPAAVLTPVAAAAASAAAAARAAMVGRSDSGFTSADGLGSAPRPHSARSVQTSVPEPADVKNADTFGYADPFAMDPVARAAYMERVFARMNAATPLPLYAPMAARTRVSPQPEASAQPLVLAPASTGVSPISSSSSSRSTSVESLAVVDDTVDTPAVTLAAAPIAAHATVSAAISASANKSAPASAPARTHAHTSAPARTQVPTSAPVLTSASTSAPVRTTPAPPGPLYEMRGDSDIAATKLATSAGTDGLVNYFMGLYRVDVDIPREIMDVLRKIPRNTAIGRADVRKQHQLTAGDRAHIGADVGSWISPHTGVVEIAGAIGSPISPEDALSWIRVRGGVIVQMPNTKWLRPQDHIVVTCRYNHVCTLRMDQLTQWCGLCIAEKRHDDVTPLHTHFSSDIPIAFVHARECGHRFIRTIKTGGGAHIDKCPCCFIEQTILRICGKQMRVLSPYEHKEALLRVHCDHCNYTFYAAETDLVNREMLKTRKSTKSIPDAHEQMRASPALSCDGTHGPISTTVMYKHLLELIFQDTFDHTFAFECAYFHALNYRLGIGMIYRDGGTVAQHEQSTIEWGKRAGVRTIVITAKSEAKSTPRHAVDTLVAVMAQLKLVRFPDVQTQQCAIDTIVAIYEARVRQRRPLLIPPVIAAATVSAPVTAPPRPPTSTYTKMFEM